VTPDLELISELQANNERLSEGWKKAIDEVLDLRVKAVALNDDVRLANERVELLERALRIFLKYEEDHDYMARTFEREGAGLTYDFVRETVK
jgi:hypothetical protein